MSKQITTAAKALDLEFEAGKIEQDDLTAYLASLDALVEQVRAVKALYKNEIAAEASRRSRAKKAAELDEMKARLAALEGASK